MLGEGPPSMSFVVAISTTWMPTSAFAGGRLSVGMTVRGIDHELELLAVGTKPAACWSESTVGRSELVSALAERKALRAAP